MLHARQWAATAGISEVRDITDLDVLDVPVFVSVRPQAHGESFTFGKGLRHVDAEVGAYMEALEFFFAEPGSGSVSTHWGSARDIAGGDRVDAILDFAPLLQREVDLALKERNEIKNRIVCMLLARDVPRRSPAG